jgi:hypothetical protein
MSVEPLALSPGAAACFLGVSKRTISNLIAAGTVVARKMSGSRTAHACRYGVVAILLRGAAIEGRCRTAIPRRAAAKEVAQGEAQDTSLSFKARFPHDSVGRRIAIMVKR